MKDSLKPFVEKCPWGCRAEVLAYHPSKAKPSAVNWPRAEYLECEPSANGTWTASAVPASNEELHYVQSGHRLSAVKLTAGQLAGAKRNGVDLHEPHVTYCANSGRKPKK